MESRTVQLSIIIPAHNEAARLPAMLTAYARHFNVRMPGEYEILVVANACSDNTIPAAEQIARAYPAIRILSEPTPTGKGGAILIGVRQARGAWIGFVDADGATAPSEFERLYRHGVGADGIIGSRWGGGAASGNRRQTGLRRVSSRLFNLFIRLMLRLPYRDTQCGAKILRARAWQTVMPHIGITRFAFDVDLLFHLRRAGLHVIEEPTRWNDVAGSTVNLMQSSLDMALAIIRIRLLYSPLRFVVTFYNRYLSSAGEFLRRDALFRHTMILSVAMVITNVCNLLFQMIVGRALPPIDYALFASFLALFAIAAHPLGTLSMAMNHYTSILMRNRQSGMLGRLLGKWMFLTLVPASILALVCIGLAEPIAGFFHLDRTAPVIIAALALPAISVTPVLSGAMAGMQRFGALSLATIIGALARVALGAILVLLVYPAAGWALSGHVGGLYVTALALAVMLVPLLGRRGDQRDRLPSLRGYLVLCFIAQFAVAFLTTGDMVMVRRYLPNETDFAYAATLGRTVVFFSTAVAAAMFPKVASPGVFTRVHRSVYLRSLLYTAVFVTVALSVCLALPGLLLRMLFGITDPGAPMIAYTRGMALVMAAASLLLVNMQLLLAQRRFGILALTIPCALGYLGAVQGWHPSAYAIIVAAGLANGLAVLTTTLGILRIKPAPADLGEHRSS